jgi:hypothetical protein
LEVDIDPSLLAEHIPAAWRLSKEMARAATVLLAANAAGCGDGRELDGAAPPAVAGNPPSTAVVAPVAGAPNRQASQYGRASTVGIVVAPRVYLSEEEALQIIREQLEAHGLQMSEQDVAMGSVMVEGLGLVDRYDWLTKTRERRFGEITEPLEVDLKDPRRDVCVEYVDEWDAMRMGGGDSVRSFQPSSVARSVSEQVREDGDGVYFGAFYDPSEDLPTELRDGHGNWRDEAEAECKRLLRQQVKGFTEWLKGQGVI